MSRGGFLIFVNYKRNQACIKRALKNFFSMFIHGRFR